MIDRSPSPGTSLLDQAFTRQPGGAQRGSHDAGRSQLVGSVDGHALRKLEIPGLQPAITRDERRDGRRPELAMICVRDDRAGRYWARRHMPAGHPDRRLGEDRLVAGSTICGARNGEHRPGPCRCAESCPNGFRSVLRLSFLEANSRRIRLMLAGDLATWLGVPLDPEFPDWEW